MVKAEKREPNAKSKSKGLAVDWGSLAPLRLRARAITEGLYAGAHRSVRRGAGIEFGGHRSYVPGDDSRFIDRRALLRHDKLMIREFETDTDRAVWLCVDATASMAYRSKLAPGAKLAFAGLVAAATARVALAGGDPVGLVFVGGENTRALPASGGREAFDRVAGAVEGALAAGDASADPQAVERALAPIARRARRGSVVVVLSDLLDLPDGALRAFTSLATGGRVVVVAHVLDPMEESLAFEGTVRLRSLEGDHVVEADAAAVREQYQARLAELTNEWARKLEAVSGRLVPMSTADEPVDAVRKLLRAIAEAGS